MTCSGRVAAGCSVLLALAGDPVLGQQPTSQPAQVLRIYLARHGQTDWNVEGRMQGGTDTPLNATGRKQALQLRLSVPLAAVYSSSLSRSRETADLVRGVVPLTSLPGLNERRFGRFEGRLTSDPETGREFERRRWIPDDSLDGGESLNAFSDRVRGAFESIRARHSSGAILIVGHGGTNQMILEVVFGLTLDEMRSINQANDEVYLIELQAEHTPRLWKLMTKATLKDL